MKIERIRNDETRDAIATAGWLQDCEIATWRGQTKIRIVGVLNGEKVDTYVEHDGKSVIGSINAFDDTGGHLVPVQAMEADLALMEAMPHLEALSFTAHARGMRPTLSAVVPGAGRLDIEMGRHDDLEAFIRRKVRERGQDGEGRTLSRLGAMTLAIAAGDAGHLDRIVDTVFAGMKGVYCGVRFETSAQGQISTAVNHKGVQMRSDGIEISNLPETVRLAILGRQRRRLDQVVDVPGFEGLEIDGISRRAMSAGRLGGQWVRVDVRDEHGAKFEQIERDEARSVAHETFTRRSA